MATFTRPNLYSVRCDEGYEVEFKGRDKIQYREDSGRAVTLDIEPILTPFLPSGREPFGLIYVRRHRAWDPQDADNLLTDQDRKRIEDRIHAALTFSGERHEFA